MQEFSARVRSYFFLPGPRDTKLMFGVSLGQQRSHTWSAERGGQNLLGMKVRNFGEDCRYEDTPPLEKVGTSQSLVSTVISQDGAQASQVLLGV